RPPTVETGWLCNGQRTPNSAAVQAMADGRGWRPPVEHAANRHSVFVDVELWDGESDERTWACAFLAAVWQLLRLGALRYQGTPVAAAQPVPDPLPRDWQAMPAVVRMNPRAAPFYAYRTVSVLGARFIPTEHAVRTILGQVAVERAVAEQLVARAAAEGVELPADLLRRIEYVFIND
ncbi:MAG TPA: SCO2522 family protein, partial [Rugosimonospora sp.]|nr:SCO2522 family protein [Rugosimonospora sp.]